MAWFANDVNTARKKLGKDSVVLIDTGDIYQGDVMTIIFEKD